LRILFVAMAESVHTARWIAQIGEQGWDIHLFPSIDYGIVHDDLKGVTSHHSFYGRRSKSNQKVRWRGIPVHSELVASIGKRALKKFFPDYRVAQLNHLIKKLKPDMIHSMEIQAGGYLTWAVRKDFGDRFPPWIITNWGSDLYLFGRLAEHADKIKAILSACDYYSCECIRDVHLAKQMGLKGRVFPVLPNTGGFDLERLVRLRQPGPPSARRLILLKGYQGWSGRALVGLRAIALCAAQLRGYRVAIFSASPEVKIAAELVTQSTGIPIDLVPQCSHDEMLRLYGRSRIYVGLGISDAISTSLLEAVVMGAFPIQSCTACADEWIVDGQMGLIVPPEDPEPVAAAIREALSDDLLVDRASELNADLARERLDQNMIRPQVVAMYERVAAESKERAS
jgi:glycosyltransferase involved in cell wall biosynthesis